ncbi:DUF2314 domain-containing protein [Wielerella bovis]|uniref:DUF2314 domain-containing protein n=1 Tax=Wielerella bovis TaxID=2917790 RepID=UPI00201A1FC3|nr:DUF2314 domain-containing protein [Wielerella bovis]ULJ63602.1 DUF2314 domain-containing protein [Wielerella bovis]
MFNKQEGIVWLNPDDDLEQAYAHARATFKYFWRELYWEYRRMIPALDFAMVKAPFMQEVDGEIRTEHMWLNEIDFDGIHISGTLVNEPHELTIVSAGERIEGLPVDAISDWMFLCQDVVYGGFTVQAARVQMDEAERAEHDEAWGLNFGEAGKTLLVYEQEAHPENVQEHPMCVNMVEKWREHLQQNADLPTESNERGYTLLHTEAIAGNAPLVALLLAHGADPKAQTDEGYTAADFARHLQWQNVLVALDEVADLH